MTTPSVNTTIVHLVQCQGKVGLYCVIGIIELSFLLNRWIGYHGYESFNALMVGVKWSNYHHLKMSGCVRCRCAALSFLWLLFCYSNCTWSGDNSTPHGLFIWNDAACQESLCWTEIISNGFNFNLKVNGAINWRNLFEL